jgi:hypothetical protein
MGSFAEALKPAMMVIRFRRTAASTAVSRHAAAMASLKRVLKPAMTATVTTRTAAWGHVCSLAVETEFDVPMSR